MKMRFRTDMWHLADFRAHDLARPVWCDEEDWNATEPAKPGDVWRVHWKGDYPHMDTREYAQGPVAGYAICCMLCGYVHPWTTATNCGSRRALPEGGSTCDHSGKGSCWTWSGSAEDNTLTCQPSLAWNMSRQGGICTYHGYLTNGELTSI